LSLVDKKQEDKESSDDEDVTEDLYGLLVLDKVDGEHEIKYMAYDYDTVFHKMRENYAHCNNMEIRDVPAYDEDEYNDDDYDRAIITVGTKGKLPIGERITCVFSCLPGDTDTVLVDWKNSSYFKENNITHEEYIKVCFV